MEHDLREWIGELIASAYVEESVDVDYQGSFADEGIRKAGQPRPRR